MRFLVKKCGYLLTLVTLLVLQCLKVCGQRLNTEHNGHSTAPTNIVLRMLIEITNAPRKALFPFSCENCQNHKLPVEVKPGVAGRDTPTPPPTWTTVLSVNSALAQGSVVTLDRDNSRIHQFYLDPP